MLHVLMTRVVSVIIVVVTPPSSLRDRIAGLDVLLKFVRAVSHHDLAWKQGRWVCHLGYEGGGGVEFVSLSGSHTNTLSLSV